MDLGTAEGGSYVCPMHPEVVSEKAEHCPKCGMKLVPAAVVAQASAHHGHGGHGGHQAGHGHHQPEGHQPTTADGIEWEDDMVDVNR